MKLIVVALVIPIALSGCSGGGDDDQATIGAPSCMPDEFKIEGELGEQPVSYQGALEGHVFVQGSMVETPFVGGGTFHAEWSDVVANGETTAIVGAITLPPEGNYGGDQLDFASGSMTKRDNGVLFTLRELSLTVTCVTAPCPVEGVDGQLSGCAEWAPIGP